ncbi:MAG: hypothetical protein NTV95_04075 [Candidatus Saccharibacteria bacterium]|nr:hypothetical protein [Candidatus Saccharibacteria bacterium]
MENIPPPQEQAHDYPLSMSEVNMRVAALLLRHIRTFDREEIADELLGLGEIVDAVIDMGFTPISEEPFDDHLSELLDGMATTRKNVKLAQHENALRRGNISIFDSEDESEIQVKISAVSAEEFKATQKHALRDDAIYSSDREDPLEKNENTLSQMMIALEDHFMPHIDNFMKMLPSEDEIVDALAIGGIIIDKESNSLDLKSSGVHIAKDNKKMKNIYRTALKTIKILQEYTRNPEKGLADIYIASVSELLIKVIDQDLQFLIVEANTSLWESIAPQKKVTHEHKVMKDTISKRDRRKLSKFLIDSAAEKDSEPIDLRTSEYEKLEGTANILMQAPWIEQSERRVNELTTQHGSVYIVDGVSEALSPIRDKTIGKNPEVESKIKGKIKAAAEKIADGHLPWNTNNLFTILGTDKEQEEYAEESIYCIKDKTQNATRIYFTMKHAEDLEVVEEGQSPTLKPTQWCMTIIAITDKDQQVDTLKQLTGRSTRYLRAYGAGSS